jgi:hypothetical protein
MHIKSILIKAGRLFSVLLLWTGTLLGTLITVSCFAASTADDDQHPIAGWIITVLVGTLTAGLWYITLKRTPRREITPSTAGPRLTGALFRFAWMLTLATLLAAGFFLTSFALFSGHWTEAGIAFLFLIALPAILIGIGLGRDRKVTDTSRNQPEVSVPYVSTDSAIFWRSRNSIIFQLAISGILIITSPLWILFLFFGIYSTQSKSIPLGLLFLLLGTIGASSFVYVIILQYRMILYRNKPLLFLDKFGLHFWRKKEEIIPWSELTSAGIIYRKGNPILLLGLSSPNHYIDRFNRWYSPDLWIGLHVLKGPESAVLQAIREHPLYQGT